MAALPFSSLNATVFELSDVTVEAHGVDDIRALNLPWIAELEPVVGDFNLLSVDNLLFEDSIIVADTIAPSRDLHSRHTVQEAGGETTETTVAKSLISLLLVKVL